MKVNESNRKQGNSLITKRIAITTFSTFSVNNTYNMIIKLKMQLNLFILLSQNSVKFALNKFPSYRNTENIDAHNFKKFL